MIAKINKIYEFCPLSVVIETKYICYKLIIKRCCVCTFRSMSSNKGENIEQIPKEDSIGKVQKAVSEQGRVEGQRKEVNVGDYVKAAALGQLLKDLEFPVDKAKIIQFVQQRQATSITKDRKEDLLYILQKYIEEGNF
jgi:hypothetical protein